MQRYTFLKRKCRSANRNTISNGCQISDSQFSLAERSFGIIVYVPALRAVECPSVWRRGPRGLCGEATARTGRLCAVVGAGQGIGRQTALALRQAGADVVCLDIDEANAAKVAVEVGGRASRSTQQTGPKSTPPWTASWIPAGGWMGSSISSARPSGPRCSKLTRISFAATSISISFRRCT